MRPTAKPASPHWHRDFTVGDRYRCTLIVSFAPGGTPAGIRIEWEPDRPRELSDFELDDYLRQRDACLMEFSRQTGYSICVVNA